MKKKCLFFLTISFVAMSLQAQRVVSTTTLVDSAAYFPQMSDDGRWLLYSNTESTVLTLLNLTTGEKAIVADNGYPGFDARMDAAGRVYYVTQERRGNGLLYRTGWRYDPANGQRVKVLKAQHGQVLPVRAGADVVIEGEKKTYRSSKRVAPYAFARGSRLHIVASGRPVLCQPAGECAGYLWAQVSPAGDKVLFEAAGRGLYVCDMQGHVLQRLEKCLMPTWLDNDHIVAMGNNGNVQRDMRSGIIVLAADGSGRTTLTAEEGCIQPSVTADGRILFTTKSGSVKLMTITLE
ncbi:MAG: hypothetical protein IJ632_02745 [Muribaculaceae bacterium]|nr:hypothetical protein [Muribaculaceae bacterium]